MGVNLINALAAEFIEFPKLGIRFDVDPVAFTLGPFKVRWYGILIAVAIMVALSLALRHTKKFDIKEDHLIDMFLLALPISIVFARLFFVVFKWDMFKNDLLAIFKVWEGGVAIFGAVIGAILAVWIYAKIKKVDMWQLADFAAVYLPLAQAIGRWGNFFNQELYGANTTLPWGMTGSIIKARPDAGIDPAIPVHPTFLYESLWNILIFFILLKIRKNNKLKGGVFAWYLALYGFGRFFTECLRVDDFQTANDVRYNQVFAALLVIGALLFLVIASRRAKRVELEAAEGPRSAYADVLETLEKEEAEARVGDVEQAEAVDNAAEEAEIVDTTPEEAQESEDNVPSEDPAESTGAADSENAVEPDEAAE